MTLQQLYGFVLKTVAILVGISALTWLVQLPYLISGFVMIEGVRVSGVQITVMALLFVSGFMLYVVVVVVLFRWAQPLAKRLAGSDAETELRFQLEVKDLLRVAVIAIGVYFALSGVIRLIGQFLSYVRLMVAHAGVVTLQGYDIDRLILPATQLVVGLLLAFHRTWIRMLAKTRRA